MLGRGQPFMAVFLGHALQDGKEGFREAGGNMLAPPQIDVSADFGVVDGTGLLISVET